MMKIGISVFAYNRDRHLQKVLDGLRKNKGIEKLYLFQDGLKCEQHRDGWEKTQQVIRAADWCEIVYRQAAHNKGLANSIVDGIDTVLKENDAIVVLEDDCVPTANFIRFMEQCFEKYQEDKRVYSVSGYAWPMDLQQDEYDIYGCGRISSWGWGTWKDRWEKYRIDHTILERMRDDREKSRYLAAWGSDCEQMLFDRIAGKNDSWAIYWALTVMEERGICISPYQSLIHNIGMDGTGVHCGVSDRFEVNLDSGTKTDFHLPDDLEILHTTEYAFADLHGNYTAASIEDKRKENVLVYGLGNFFKKYEKEMNSAYHITAFIDQNKRGLYAGREVLKLCDVKDCAYDRIILMVQSIRTCLKVVREMIDNGIDYESIILGHSLYGIYSQTMDEISIMDDGRLCVKAGHIPMIIESEEEFHNIYDVFVKRLYDYFVNNARRDVIIDVGMNTRISSPYFAQQEKVEKVYGYEPFRKTFGIFQYGISAEKEKTGQREVRRASEVLEPVFKKHPHHNIILKMACEGEEYRILEELLQSEVLEKFQVIMLACHCKGREILLDCLKKAGFSWWCSEQSEESVLVHAYRCGE